MKAILVPTDFSDHALFALKVAASIARKLNAKINLVHNYSMPSEGFDNAYFYEESYPVFEKIKLFADLYKAHIYLLKVITPKEFEPTPVSQKLLNRFINKFNLKNYSVSIYNSQNIETGIIEFSDEVNADLIAIETHGRTGLAHLINGSLAEDIVKHEAKPVLSIKIPALSKSALKFMGYKNDYENWRNLL